MTAWPRAGGLEKGLLLRHLVIAYHFGAELRSQITIVTGAVGIALRLLSWSGELSGAIVLLLGPLRCVTRESWLEVAHFVLPLKVLYACGQERIVRDH